MAPYPPSVPDVPWRAVSLGLSAALLGVLAFPPFELAPISWIALVPLFVVVLGAESTGREVLWAGGVFGLVTYAVCLRWLYEIFGVAALALWAFLAWMLGRTLWMAWRLGQRWGDRGLVLALPTFWVGLEHFRSECWLMKFGWVTPGYAQASDAHVLQAAEVVGVYGLSFVVVLTSALAAWGITRRGASRSARILALASVPLAYGVLFAYGARRIDALAHESDPRITVALVQYETNRFEDAETLLSRVPAGTQLVVFPELGAVYREGHLTWLEGREADLAARARDRGALLVVGGEREVPGARSPLTDFYNSLALIEPDGRISYYTKAEPVPLFADGVASDEVHAYDTSLGRLGFAICYDFTHPHVVDALVGARAFVVASGDLASWTELQHREHALVTRLRAVEHRRWVARATSSGYSQILDPTGRVVSELGFGEVGVLSGEIGLRDDATLYELVGLWPARLALALWALGIARELYAWWSERRAARRASAREGAAPGAAGAPDSGAGGRASARGVR